MPPLIRSKRGSLGSAKANLSGPLDLVEQWKMRVRSKLARNAELAGMKPTTAVHVDVRVVVFAAAFGLAGGPIAAIRALVSLLSILLVHEGSRAVLARGLGRSSRSSISLAGGQTEISGPELRGAAALAFTLIGSLGFVAISSLRAAREAFREEFDRQHGVLLQHEQARAALAAGEPRRALLVARTALALARSAEQRQNLWSTFAWAGIADRDPFAAHAALQQLPEARLDVHLLAAYLSCCNRNLEAQELLEEARRLGLRSKETSKLLIEVLFAQGDRAGALTVVEADAALLSQEDRQSALSALASAGA
jgi:hypothetical protein